jgi:uncharacterized DUF497 family protein
MLRNALALSVPDERYADRWITIGEVDGRLIVVVHIDVEVDPNEGAVTTRIISARRATRRECDDYRRR